MNANIAPDGGRGACLRRLGLAEDEARAVEQLWNWPALRLIADERVIFFADNGYDVLETLDAIWHGLDGVVGHTYMQHGLTPHQGFLIHNSPKASHNMWGADRDIDRVHSLLNAAIPTDVAVVLLLEADTPEEAETLINHYDYAHRADDQLDQRVTTILAHRRSRFLECDCLRPAAGASFKT